MIDPQRAVVLFSGGQDSTTCLAWALERFEQVETVGFDYGQRHRVELEVRPKILAELRQKFPNWAHRLREDHLLDMSILGQVSETSLTRNVAIAMEETGLPNTFVPGRNLVFLTFAAALAYRRGAKHLVTGVCETDYSGYPDCRDDTMKAMQLALNLGMETRFVIHTPLMWIDKAQTWAMAEELGGAKLVDLVRESTHTCYEGDRTVRHEWGYGCGRCPACELRGNGWWEFSSGSSAARRNRS
jgi:7-cyano-7-deazaguanine synthase